MLFVQLQLIYNFIKIHSPPLYSLIILVDPSVCDSCLALVADYAGTLLFHGEFRISGTHSRSVSRFARLTHLYVIQLSREINLPVSQFNVDFLVYSLFLVVYQFRHESFLFARYYVVDILAGR